MLSPAERKKLGASKALMKKYEEVFAVFFESGYTKELCEAYADAFIDNVKKPAVEDIVQLSALYDRIHDPKTSYFYLEMLLERKLGGEEKFAFCVEMLKIQSKLGQWRDADDFRTDNINFMQNFAQKRSPKQQAEMYIALALVDCAAKRYYEAFKLLKFGYKPQGKNDTTLLEILITGVYIFSCAGDEESLRVAVENAKSCLKLFSSFDFSWSKEYYEKRITDAANGIL